MKEINVTPQQIFDQLRKTIIGQDDYLKALSNAAWLHGQKYQHFMDTSDLLDKPKQNLLIIGRSGTGKTLAVQTLGRILNLPVIIEDASALTGEGWRGKSVSNICERIHRATDKAEDKIYSIICLDEIDKVFRSSRTNASGAADSGFLPLNNLLTFLAGGMITCTENNSKCSIDSSNFLVICLGAFEGLDEIIEKRLTGTRQIGFCSNGHEEPDTDDLLQYVTETDLHEYGIPWEFLGRLSLITRTRQLGIEDYKRILTQSDASPVVQYHYLLSHISDIRVSITDAAVRHIADKAGQSDEGARMLTRLVTDTLQQSIFNIGQDRDIDGIEIDCNNSGLFTRSEYDAGQKKKHAEPLCYVNYADLSTVPLQCRPNRGEIRLLAEKIKKSSPRSWMLPEQYVSASTCVLAAAICSLLADVGDGEKNMQMLYNRIDFLPDIYMPDHDRCLTQIMDEFTQKAQKDIDLEKAKTNARQFITDYCRNYSLSQDGRERQSEPGLLRSRRTYGGTYPSAGGRVPPTFVIIGNRKEITMEDKRYMDFSDIKLQQPLSNVKRTEKTNDTLIIPANFLTTMERFFDAEKTEYTTIENPSLYSQDKINASLDRFTELDHVFIMEEPVLFISPFDAEALFKWTQQLYGETMDPSYRQYLDDQNAASEEYYYKYEAE